MDIIQILLCIFLPPVAVFVKAGATKHFWINIVLCVIGFGIGGIIHAFWFVSNTKEL